MTISPTPPPRTVLVLGANGRFGMAAAKAFDAAGWHVLAHVRRDAAAGMPARAELLHAPLEGVAAALDHRAASARARGSASATATARNAALSPSVVVHGINPIYTRWDEEALPAARAGMAIAERLGARFMLPGNVYNYGEAMPALLDETTPQRPSTTKGRIRAEMEAEIEGRAAAGQLSATVITAGDFFGEGSGSWLDQVIVKPIAKGKLDYPGDPAILHAWAYLPDLARAFVAVAEAPAARLFERFTFAGHALTGHDFIAALERAASRSGLTPAGGWRHGRMPWTLVRAIGVFVPMYRELARMSYLWRVPHALDGGRLAARCPGLVATPIDAALAASLDALGLRPADTGRSLAPAPGKA